MKDDAATRMDMVYVCIAICCVTHVRQPKVCCGYGTHTQSFFLANSRPVLSFPPKTTLLYLQLAGSCTDWCISSHSASRTCAIATTFDTTQHFDNLPMTSATITTTSTSITTPTTTTTTTTLGSGRDAVLNHRLDSMSLEGKVYGCFSLYPTIEYSSI